MEHPDQLSVVHQLIQNKQPIKQPHPVRFVVWRRGAGREVSDMSNSEVITARLLSFAQMYSYEKRLQTFSEWPFREDCQCTPELMAKAGFVHCPSENEPDVACCFYCLRELEGWEPDDNPWTEHAKRSPNCAFLHLKKTFEEVTAIEFFHLEQERLRVYIKKMVHMKIANFRDEVEAISKNLRALI